MAILKLCELNGYRDRVIYCTLKDICDAVGFKPGGTTYQRLKDALLRFSTTTYVSDRVFRDRASGDTVGLETWEIIVETRFTADGNAGVLPCYFEVGKRFLDKLRQGQLKPVDLALWRQLPLGLEKPLYHHLSKKHGGRRDLEGDSVNGHSGNPASRSASMRVAIRSRLVRFSEIRPLIVKPGCSSSTTGAIAFASSIRPRQTRAAVCR